MKSDDDDVKSGSREVTRPLCLSFFELIHHLDRHGKALYHSINVLLQSSTQNRK